MEHYGVVIVPDAHQNAANVVFALWQVEDTTASRNVSQPLNATSSPNDPVTHWAGGRPFLPEELLVLQDFPANIPSASWPVQGVDGPVTEQQAIDAATALIITVRTAETYTSLVAVATLAAALGSLGLKRVNYDEE